MPIEREAKEHCSVLLIVVCGDTLSVASMVEAAYSIGKCRNIVLCISDVPMPDGESSYTEIEGMKVHICKGGYGIPYACASVNCNYHTLVLLFHLQTLIRG